jgi:predicted nuclease of predicted toxin-antitoxin system
LAGGSSPGLLCRSLNQTRGEFLIDECLSPALVGEAQASGSEAHHLAHIGGAGSPDRQVVAHALVGDLVLVTNNVADFRRLYAAQDLHPGLVILIPNTDRETQVRLFRAVLARLGTMRDLVNKGLEVDLADERITFVEYELPHRF